MTARSTAPVDPLEPEIRALRQRQRALEAALGTGESAEGWHRAQEALDRLDAALHTNPATPQSLRDLNASLATLRAVLRDGVAADTIWKEIRRNAEAIRRLVDSTRRRTSPQDRLADREADREARLSEALAEAGLPAPTRPARRARADGAAGP